MDAVRQALKILCESEDALSALMREALEEQKYRDVALVAPITGSLRELISSLQVESSENGRVESTGDLTPARRRSAPRKPKRSVRRHEYPRFERDGERLVKIGWSRKKKEEYEHRAPKEAVSAFVAAVGQADLPGGFRMDTLLPLKDATGEEVPSYQAYLALAWLRSLDIITGDGKGGYRIDKTRLTPESVEGEWKGLRRHGQQR